MIHQLIFAAPKPGMTAEEFQDYWVNVHAVKYASKITQIKKYMIDTRILFAGDFGQPLLPHQGVAEIWIEPEDQIASLQSKEFLEGARLDEPKWAAFWQTFVIDTTAHEIIAGPTLTKNQNWVKMIILHKRILGLPVETYRQYCLKAHAPLMSELPDLRRYLQCHTVDGYYVIGESACFDGAEIIWFDSAEMLADSLASDQFRKVRESWNNFVNPKYIFSITAEEHWVIGPDERP
jgi:uncharacterized protein (TIGR02118 family)